MKVSQVKVGMIFKGVDWDGPSTVVVLKVDDQGILIARVNPRKFDGENTVILTDTPFGDERELLLEGSLIGGINLSEEA